MKTLEIDQDDVLDHMLAFNKEDSERASDAGESRQRIGEFLDKTGLNNKAFAFVRMVLRVKKDEKRQDILRSMRALMPILEQQIADSGTRDAFDVPAEARDLAADGFPDPTFEADMEAQADDAGDHEATDADELPEDAESALDEIGAGVAADAKVKRFTRPAAVA
jgi:hypothetical protein